MSKLLVICKNTRGVLIEGNIIMILECLLRVVGSFVLLSANCFMSQKQPKPTLSGQRIRTRKRGIIKKNFFFKFPFEESGTVLKNENYIYIQITTRRSYAHFITLASLYDW